MKIELNLIKVRDVVEDYIDSDEEGVYAYGGLLNVRPKYQREFIYKQNQMNAVIKTIERNFPLNTMYWAKNDDGTYEVCDGQQRLISILSYINGDYSVDFRYFFNLSREEKEKILNYELTVYICEGTESEKLDWFQIINIAGEKLTDQELRNAVYSGSWITDAKRHFSKTNCPAQNTYKDYLSGSAIRQDYLETAIKWASNKENAAIEEYMAKHQHDVSASLLWQYFQQVMNWVKTIFPTYRKEMKGVDWGFLYNKCHNNEYDASVLESKIKELMIDDDVTKKSGIYEYLLTGSERALSLRSFTEKMKREAYERQNGICPKCGEHFEINEMQGDHIKPWSEGGHTTADNLQMLCKDCNRKKSNI